MTLKPLMTLETLKNLNGLIKNTTIANNNDRKIRKRRDASGLD